MENNNWLNTDVLKHFTCYVKTTLCINTIPMLIYKCRIDKLDGLPSVPSVRVGIRSQGFNSERTHCDVMKFFSRALLCDLFFHFFLCFYSPKSSS